MRPELYKIELIEKYLRNELSQEERQEFEDHLQNDPEFKKELEIQEHLLKGVERIALKQVIKRSYQQFVLKKLLLKLGLSGLAISIIIAAVFLLTDKSFLEGIDGFSLISSSEPEAVFPEDHLEKQIFDLSLESDTVIETKGGIVLSIPKDAFVDEKGLVVKEPIQFELSEALEPYDIIKAGLSTMADSNLLETGGMFFIDAKQDGQSLSVNPESKLLVDVPTNHKKQDMLLFDGIKDSTGNVNWVNPVALENSLIPVDIFSLNFYPEGFEDTLLTLDYDISNKTLKDSLFYSFECESNNISPNQIWDESLVSDSLSYFDSFEAATSSCGIEPSQIKAIWNENFQNTLIATKAFEERLKYMYKVCDKGILELYIENINSPISEIDLKVANILSGKHKLRFLNYASRKGGSVNLEDRQARALAKYYQKKSIIYANAVSTANRSYWKEFQKYQEAYRDRKNLQESNDARYSRENFQKELNHNLDEAYRQLGAKRPRNVIPPKIDGVYRINVASLGWKNIDRYVVDATINRETLSQNIEGKTIEIKYEAFKAFVNADDYELCRVYLIASQLPHFRKLNVANNTVEERLNALMNYNLICVAFKGEEQYFFEHKNIQALDSLRIKLKSTDKASVKRKLRNSCGFNISQAVTNDLSFGRYELQYHKRINEHANIQEIRWHLYDVIFPCNALDVGVPKFTTYDLEEIDSNIIDQSVLGETSVFQGSNNQIFLFLEDQPQFGNDNQALGKWMRKNLIYPQEAIDQNIQGRVYVSFIIDENGEVIDEAVVESVHPVLDQEALRLFRNMPNWTPGKMRGKPVAVEYVLPVNFSLY